MHRAVGPGLIRHPVATILPGMRCRPVERAIAVRCGLVGVFATALLASASPGAAAAATLIPTSAARAFVAQLPPEIYIPAKEGGPCPRVEIFSGQSECFLEYRYAGRLQLASGLVTIRNDALAVRSFSDHSWVRKWVGCSLQRWPVAGRLTSNNA